MGMLREFRGEVSHPDGEAGDQGRLFCRGVFWSLCCRQEGIRREREGREGGRCVQMLRGKRLWPQRTVNDFL